MTPKIITKIKQWWFITLLFSFPLLFLSTLGYIVVPYLHSYYKEVIAFGIFTFSCLLLSALLNFNKTATLFLLILLSLITWLKLSVYHLFGSRITTSTFYTILETNKNESLEFFINYLDYKSIIGFLITIAFFTIVYRNYKSKKSSLNIYYKTGILGILCFNLYVIYIKFPDEDIFLKIYSSSKSYIKFKDQQQSTLSQHINPIIQLKKQITNYKQPETHIVIIGESTSRNHMQLYGYPRETTPLLSSIKQELHLFSDVISPNAFTLSSIEKILTLKHYKDMEPDNNASIVQLANANSFNTYWISNQEPYGVTETLATVIANACDEKYFLSSDSYAYNIHDENILPKLGEILKKPERKKIIFIHLIGNHAIYNRRYPKPFNYFKDTPPKAKFASTNSQFQKVNEYDNAVRYNDFVVYSILEKLKELNQNSFLCYFSDHGEEVYDTSNYIGHWQSSDLRSKVMFEIPFILWFSEKYKNKPYIDSNTLNRKYNLEDFIHTFSELSHTESNFHIPQKSIINSSFKYKRRQIYKEFYDEK